MRPSLNKMLQQDKCFDIVKVTDTLDAALGYTREFLFPERAHKNLIDLPDSKASKVCADHPKNLKNSENMVRVKRKYTKRNKDAQNVNKKAAGCETDRKMCSKDKKVKNSTVSGTNQDIGKKGKSKKNLDSSNNAGAGAPSVSNSNKTRPRGGSKEDEQDGGSELPVLEKHHVAPEKVNGDGIVVPPSGDPPTEDPEMPELTITAL